MSFKVSFYFQYYVKKAIFRFKKRAPQLKKLHLNTFPAIHIKNMDWLDFGLKFSGELLVLTIAIVVAGFNVYYFSASSHPGDQSLAAVFLNNHQKLNLKLANKNSALITIVTPRSFIAQAQADDFAGLDTQNVPLDNGSDAGVVVNEDGLINKPNPDSIQGLIAKQIKIYQTVSGDSLKSIAVQNGISAQTIKWANNLNSDNIKPGWYLLIPPVDGIIAKANSNDTLPDFAAKYNPQRYNSDKKIRDDSAAKLLDTIISYNGLADAEDIDDGQIVIIPGGAVTSPPAPPAPAPAPAPKKPGAKPAPNYAPDPGSDYSESGHLFPWGYCTWYVASRIHVPWGGNAKNWLANAKAFGAVVSNEPAVGTIVVTTESRRYGHVAIVEAVTDSTITVSEMNYKGKGVEDRRVIARSSGVIRGYIYK